jgi:hypothetical protein
MLTEAPDVYYVTDHYVPYPMVMVRMSRINRDALKGRLLKAGWRFVIAPKGAGSQLEVEARSPAVTHTVSMAKVQDWLRSSAKSPSDKIMHEGTVEGVARIVADASGLPSAPKRSIHFRIIRASSLHLRTRIVRGQLYE